MQRLIISLVGLAVTLLLIAAPGLAGPPLTQTKEKIIAAVPRSFPPHYLLDAEGKPSGFAIDVMERLATFAGLKVEYLIKANWVETFDAVKRNEAQIIPNLGIAPGRGQYLDFTSPIETFEIVLFVRKATAGVEGLDDLANRRVGAASGNLAVKLLAKHGRCIPVIYDSPEEGLTHLLSGDVDAFAYPRSVFLELARRARLEGLIKVAGPQLIEVKRAVGVRDDRPQLLARLNQAIKVFIGSPEYQALYAKWHGSPPPFWDRERIIWTMAGLLLACLLGMAMWRYLTVVRLNRQLEAAIKERGEAEAKASTLATMVSTSQESMIGMDKNGMITSWNAGAEKLYGHDANDVVGRHISILIPEGHADHGMGYLRKALAGEMVEQYETVRQAKDGRLLEVSLTISPILDEMSHQIGVSAVTRDISNRKRAEEALRASEEKFATAFQRAPLMMTISSLTDGTYLEVNDTFCEVSGFSREEALGRTSVDLGWLAAEDRIELTQVLGAQGWVRNKKLSLRAKDGRQVECLFSGEIIIHQNIKLLLTVALDVTERNRAEEELRRKGKDLQESQKIAKLGSWRLNVQTNEVCWTEELYRMYGFDPSQPPPPYTEHMKLFTPESWELLSTSLARTVETGVPYELELEMAKPDGGEGWMWVRGEAITDERGKNIEIWGAVRDVTDHKLAEMELRKKEQYHRQIVQTAMDGFLRIDAQARVVEVNEAYCRMIGYSEEELLAMSVSDLVRQEAPKETAARIKRIIEKGADRFTSKHHCKDGSIIDVEVSIQYKAGESGGEFVSFVRDVTEQRLIEAQLRQSQKMEAVGTLAGGIAHDFNNILGAVIGFAEIARDDALENRTNPDDIEQIISAAERARDLVKQILTFSRRDEQDLQPLRLDQAVRNARQILDRTLPKMISIENELHLDLLVVLADPTQVEQVLLNLASNAADAMPDGGRLIMTTRGLRVDADVRKRHPEIPIGDYALLEITDTGCGIDPQTRDRIFEPFFTTKKLGKGTGLGLSTVYGIVKSHGGFIYCQSEPGQGTTFSIYLPIMVKEQAENEVKTGASAEKAADNTGTETILVIDDEEALRSVAGQLLGRAGYRVLEASSGEEGLGILAKQPVPPDLVLTDLGMPGMGGHKAMCEIFARYPGAKVVIVTGYAAQDQVAKALEAGAAAYVAKPFNRDELLGKVRGVLDERD